MRRLSPNVKGFSLIEVLVYIAISGILLASLYRLFASSHATYARGESRMDIQQNARVGIDEITRELRMAGYYPENFDGNSANNISVVTPVQIATNTALAVRGDMDGSGSSSVFLFCLDGNVLRRVKGTSGILATYTCSSGDSLAESVTSLRFSYYDTLNVSVPNPETTPFQLDGQSIGTVPSFTDLSLRQTVRRVVITVSVRKDSPEHGPQIYTLTSDIRFRNLN